MARAITVRHPRGTNQLRRRNDVDIVEGLTPVGGLDVAPPSGRVAIQNDVAHEQMAGINIIFNNAQSVYGNWQECSDLAIEAGFRTVRARINSGNNAARNNMRLAFPYLAANGVRIHGAIGVFGGSLDAAQNTLDIAEITRNGSDCRSIFKSFGNWNEPNDDPLVANWAATCAAQAQDVYTKINNDLNTNGIPISAPTMKDNVSHSLQGDFQNVTGTTTTKGLASTDIANWVDIGDIHKYTQGARPTDHLDERFGWMKSVFGTNDPYYYCTEQGACNDLLMTNGPSPLGPVAHARYALKTMVEHYIRKSHAFLFELVNDPDPDHNDPQAHWGFIEVTSTNPSTWTKNPSFDAIKRFTTLIKDPGVAFTTTNLNMSLDIPSSSHKDFLTQKRNGKYYLFLWRDESFWNTGNKTDINLANVDRTLTLGTAKPVALYNPRLQTAPVSTFASSLTHTLPVGSDVMVAEIG